MHDLQLVLEELETAYHIGCNACQNMFWDTSAVEIVETACVHVFHAVVNTTLDEKGAVKVDDLGCDCAVEDVEFHEDGIEFGVVEFEANFLQRDERVVAA